MDFLDKTSFRKKILLPLKIIFNSNLYNILGFNTTINLLSFITGDKKWFWYVKNRESIPSFFYSLLCLPLISKNDHVLDIGSGTGNFLREISKVTKKKNIIGLDNSALSLMIADRFIVKEGVKLEVASAEKGLAFEDSKFDFIHVSDTFQYIKNKSQFLKECKRVLKSEGILCVLQTLQKSQGNILGVTYKEAEKMLRKLKFKHYAFFSNATLLDAINNENSLNLQKGDTAANLNSAFSYSFFAFKSKMPKKLSITNELKNRFISSKINYTQEPWLQNELNKRKFLKYDKYIFVSPHLDDAVLSCGSLIKELKNLGKKVEVITVFTRPGDKTLSPQAKEFLNSCGYSDPNVLYKDMRNEDKYAMKLLGVKFLHLGFIDAAWRLRKNERTPVYKNAKIQFAGEISSFDNPIVLKLQKIIKMEVKSKDKNILILSPLGIGGHADHVLISKACTQLALQRETTRMWVTYWEDFPYNTYPTNIVNFFRKNKGFNVEFDLKEESTIKEKAIRKYKSQINHLFKKDIIPKIAEKYYSKELKEPEH